MQRGCTVLACLAALALPASAMAGPSGTQTGGSGAPKSARAGIVKTRIHLDAGAVNTGFISSANDACIFGRTVTVRYRDADGKKHFLGKAKTDDGGGFIATGGSLKGAFPYRVQAVVAKRKVGKVTCGGAHSVIRIFHPA